MLTNGFLISQAFVFVGNMDKILNLHMLVSMHMYWEFNTRDRPANCVTICLLINIFSL